MINKGKSCTTSCQSPLFSFQAPLPSDIPNSYIYPSSTGQLLTKGLNKFITAPSTFSLLHYGFQRGSLPQTTDNLLLCGFSVGRSFIQGTSVCSSVGILHGLQRPASARLTMVFCRAIFALVAGAPTPIPSLGCFSFSFVPLPSLPQAFCPFLDVFP